MKLDITDVETSSHQNFLDYIRNDKTRIKYSSDLQKFLDLIPDKIFQDKKIDCTDKTEAFVTLVRTDVKLGKSIINAYVRELKKKVDDESISPARVLNLIKPIKALFAANDIDFSWKMISKSIPKPGKSKDKAYSREQLQMLMANATNLVDKVMITLCSSAGFRIEAWDYFTWEDVIFFYNDDNSLKGGAVNASVLPKTFQVAKFVEEAIRDSGVKAPLMIMKGDGGVTSMDTFKTKPILTILSGPAASVSGALLHLKVTNGIFVEVGGTSTNICIIKNGRPEFRYVTIKEHPTCVRSMDVRILGVAGGSMVRLKDNRVWNVGPRSAHIAGLKYACFADPEDLKTGKIVLIKPKETDVDEYVAIKCKENTYAITNTCAANALGMIDEHDYAFANQESSKIAMKLLAKFIGVNYSEISQSIILTSSFEITKTISKIISDVKLNPQTTKIIGGGGGASVLVPFVAKQLGLQYQKAEHAEVISSIGVASSMLQEEIEQTVINPTPEQISLSHKKIHSIMVDKGATPESIVIDSQYIPEKSLLRVTAIGNVELDSVDTAKSVFTLQEAKTRTSEILQISEELIDLSFESDHYLIFNGHIAEKHFFSKKNRHPILVLDRFGKMKMSLKNGKIFQGGKISILEELDDFLESRNNDVAPQVYLVNDFKLIDYSSLTSSSHILNAVRQELDENERASIIIQL
jgi:N-methylhydantoinase A